MLPAWSPTLTLKALGYVWPCVRARAPHPSYIERRAYARTSKLHAPRTHDRTALSRREPDRVGRCDAG